MLRAGWDVAFAADAIVVDDVTYPGFAWQLKRALKNENLAPVLAVPEIRRELFWNIRIFFRPRKSEVRRDNDLRGIFATHFSYRIASQETKNRGPQPEGMVHSS